MVAMMIIAMSCFIDRRSGDFECDNDDDCAGFEDPDRVCSGGVCIPLSCPAICDGGCSGSMCTINCSTPNECRNGVSCPSGFTCKFNCDEDCTPVNCPLGCTVVCDGATTDCGPINCGTGATCSCSGVGNCN